MKLVGTSIVEQLHQQHFAASSAHPPFFSLLLQPRKDNAEAASLPFILSGSHVNLRNGTNLSPGVLTSAFAK